MGIFISYEDAVHNHQNLTHWFKQSLENSKIFDKLTACKLLICDVDGTLTDNGLLLSNETDELKVFSVADGYGISHALQSGLAIAWLSGKTSKMVSLRAQRLGIPKTLCIQGKSQEKNETVQAMQKEVGASYESTIFMGDDILDARTKKTCSFFVAPANAPFYIQSAADLLLPLAGGNGAVRLLIDLILYAQKKHFAQRYINTALAHI